MFIFLCLHIRYTYCSYFIIRRSHVHRRSSLFTIITFCIIVIQWYSLLMFKGSETDIFRCASERANYVYFCIVRAYQCRWLVLYNGQVCSECITSFPFSTISHNVLVFVLSCMWSIMNVLSFINVQCYVIVYCKHFCVNHK